MSDRDEGSSSDTGNGGVVSNGWICEETYCISSSLVVNTVHDQLPPRPRSTTSTNMQFVSFDYAGETHHHRITNLLPSAIAGQDAGGHGGSRCSSAASTAAASSSSSSSHSSAAASDAALPGAVVAQDLPQVPLLPHGRGVGLADGAARLQTQRHRRRGETSWVQCGTMRSSELFVISVRGQEPETRGPLCCRHTHTAQLRHVTADGHNNRINTVVCFCVTKPPPLLSASVSSSCALACVVRSSSVHWMCGKSSAAAGPEDTVH